MVAALMHAMTSAGEFSAVDGLSAAMTFTYRFANAIIDMSKTSEAKGLNTEAIVGSLKRMAATIAFERQTEKLTIH